MTDREKFEAWFRKHYCIPGQFCRHDKSGDYENLTVRASWRAWQAALASQQPADDGWIEWPGGECPVKLNAMVEVRHRSEKWCNSRITAAVADWRHKSWCSDTDIIAYRVVKP